jgi:hypothetical protein
MAVELASGSKWGIIRTSVEDDGNVTQAVGNSRPESLNRVVEADAILAERQEWNTLAAKAFDAGSKIILATTAVSQVIGAGLGALIIGGFAGAVSHLASDSYQSRADLSSMRREEVVIADSRSQKPQPQVA